MSSKLTSWLLLAIIFLVGVITGSALTVGFGHHFVHPPGAQQIRKLWMQRLTERLDLTSDQQAKIDPILNDAETKIQALHRDEVQQGYQIFKSAHDQIATLLTPAQQAELQKMDSEREKMFSSRADHWGGYRSDAGGPPPSPPPPPGP